MALENEDGQEKTEEPTQERREEFREKGEIAVSREFASVAVLAGCVALISATASQLVNNLKSMLTHYLRTIETPHLNSDTTISHLSGIWIIGLRVIIPVFLIASVLAIVSTFSQTRMSFSMQRLSPNLDRFNPIQGISRFFSVQAAVELAKGVAKIAAIAIVAYLILHKELGRVPSLVNLYLPSTFSYWGAITKNLFWSVSGLLLVIAGADYAYTYFSLERRMRMTKKEVKEDYRKREVDPMVRGKMRRMQREFSSRKSIEGTRKATVLITNPTHYSIAIRYELGMDAPVIMGKGVDFVALRMREVAKELDIPIVENKALARTLYKIGEVGQEIPESLYTAISEVIRYVFRIKGIKIQKSKAASVN